MKDSIVFLVSTMIGIAASAQHTFNSLDTFFNYAAQKSITLQSNDIKLMQAKKAKLAAKLSVIDPTENASLAFTDNTKLPVTLFPSDAFGGAPGTYKEIKSGIQYNTSFSQNADIKLFNLGGWENLRLAKLNIDLTNASSKVSVKNLYDDVASSYYNIVTLQEQLKSTLQNLAVADTLHKIAENKYALGLVKQQDVNDTKASYLNTKESLHQIEFSIRQYYISLKILCDIPESEVIMIDVNNLQSNLLDKSAIDLNLLNQNYSLLKQKYAESNYLQIKKATFLPTLSFTASNAYTLYNQSFKVFDGKWYNSQSIGLKLALPLPNASSLSNAVKAKYDYQLAKKTAEQSTITAELDRQQLGNEYDKALSQYQTNMEIFQLRKDSYQRNKNLYTEGLFGMDQTLNSFNAMVNARYSLISSQIAVLLAQAKIDINNKIK
ncbi:TolC family protein [Parasediminibacterium sp. JCM 36343]|uniref:TolC family protein n=1 Tax=Parasediminibacterium sp. JCM 36343 TaxID=3374279 RepID=UPI003978961F